MTKHEGDVTAKAGNVYGVYEGQKLTLPCKMWPGKSERGGYGIIFIGGKTLAVHRVSYRLNVGSIPRGMYVCHKCDNKRCYEPSHLFLGTNADNQRDLVAKGLNIHSKKTHCINGHEYSPENTWTYHRKRRCRSCHRINLRNGRVKIRDARTAS